MNGHRLRTAGRLALPQHPRTLADITCETLQQAILSGQFAPGSQLPAEFDLVVQLGISRTTLREALKRLEEQGLIIRRRGRGTYVRERTAVADLSINFSLSDMMTRVGIIPSVHSITVQRQPAPAEVAVALALPECEPLVVVERVRTADGRPVVWSRDMLPANRLGPAAPAAGDFARCSFYQFLASALQLRVTRGVAQLTPVTATAELAARLDVRRGTPLLRMAQTDYDVNDRPVLYSVEYHLPNAFVFLVNRKGPHW